MSELNQVNSEFLSVTPQHEDEGYLSPSEEDLKRSFGRKSGGYLTCKPPSSLNLYGYVDTPSEPYDEPIPWEELFQIPFTINEHFSWDRLLPPVPYRFHEEHRACLRQVRKSPSTWYLSDDTKNYAAHTEHIWRCLTPLPNIKQNVITTGKRQIVRQEALRQVQSVCGDPVKLSRCQFVQHIFHLLCARESVSFTRLLGERDRHKFSKNPRVVVAGMSPGCVASLSEPYLKAGGLYKRLSFVAALHYDEQLMEREGLGANAVITAYLKFISEYLKLYQTSLMLKCPTVQTFIQLNLFYRPFGEQLAILAKMLDLYLSTDQLTFLKGLNTMMLGVEAQHIASLLRTAFAACASAYLRYVADWVFRGSLTEGFHVQRTRAFDYVDRRYWVKQFSQNTSVPKFLESSVNIIFETGKAINLLNVIRRTQPRTCFLTNILCDDATLIRPATDSTEMSKLAKAWRIKLESFFAEHSFLEDSIKEALESERKADPIDFNVIEEERKLFEVRRTENQRQILDRKIEKQKYWHDILTKQLEEKKDIEKQAIEDDRIENEKIRAYIDKQDRRDLDEEQRLMDKHFGGRIKETVGLRNVRERIANTQNYEENPVIDTVTLFKKTDAICLENDEVESSIVDAVNNPVIPMDTEGPMSHGEENKTDEPVHEIDSIVQEEVISLATAHSTDSSSKNNGGEDKFDPSNVKTRSAIPYNLDLDFKLSDFVALPQPLSKLDISFDDTEQEDSPLRHDSLFLNYFFQQSTIIPVEAQNRMVNSALLYYFINEKKLFQHLETLNKYLCLQNGLFGHFLTKLFLQEIKMKTLLKKDDIPRKATRLNEILREALTLSSEGSDRLEATDNLAFILVREGNRSSVDFDAPKVTRSKSLSTKYDVLDNLTLNYSVEWPLSILLTEDLLINYEKLFTFLMKLYRAEFLLLEMFSVLKMKGKTSAQLSVLHQCRYRMLHFVRSVRHYINVTVIDCAWAEMVANFHKLNSLDKLYEGLVRHIKSISTNCLLGTKGEGVKKLLIDQLTLIEGFCEDVDAYSQGVDWNAGEEFSVRSFARLRQKFKAWEEIQKVFLQVFFKLADKGIYPKVSYFLQLFNFNEYFERRPSSMESSSSRNN